MRGRILLFLALAGWAGVACTQAVSESEMLIAASALTKVSAATEATERYGSPPGDLGGQAFIDFATAHDPALLHPLAGYRIEVLRKDRHTVLLLCDSAGQRALLEDVGCTGAMDRHRWQGDAAAPCEFSAEPTEVCGIR